MTLGLNGVELSYTDLGSGDPLLLVHGTGAYSAIWGEVCGQLAGSRRVIVYDRRGFGASQGVRARHVHQHAEDAAALLEHLEAVPAVVVGWSGGGVVALDLAASRPDLVSSLVLIEPAVSLILAPSAGVVRMSALMQFRWRIRRDERFRRRDHVSLGQRLHHRRQRIRPAPARRAGGDAGTCPLDVAGDGSAHASVPPVQGGVEHRLSRDLSAGVAQRPGVPACNQAPSASASANQGRRDRGRRAHAASRSAG